jgi:hypothetical protein
MECLSAITGIPSFVKEGTILIEELGVEAAQLHGIDRYGFGQTNGIALPIADPYERCG